VELGHLKTPVTYTAVYYFLAMFDFMFLGTFFQVKFLIDIVETTKASAHTIKKKIAEKKAKKDAAKRASEEGDEEKDGENTTV